MTAFGHGTSVHSKTSSRHMHQPLIKSACHKIFRVNPHHISHFEHTEYFLNTEYAEISVLRMNLPNPVIGNNVSRTGVCEGNPHKSSCHVTEGKK
jgi:hypothetical protein